MHLSRIRPLAKRIYIFQRLLYCKTMTIATGRLHKIAKFSENITLFLQTCARCAQRPQYYERPGRRKGMKNLLGKRFSCDEKTVEGTKKKDGKLRPKFGIAAFREYGHVLYRRKRQKRAPLLCKRRNRRGHIVFAQNFCIFYAPVYDAAVCLCFCLWAMRTLPAFFRMQDNAEPAQIVSTSNFPVSSPGASGFPRPLWARRFDGRWRLRLR